MNDAGIAAMHRRKRAAQPVGIGRHQDEMHVVGHQAPGPYFNTCRAAALGQQIAVERIIVGAEECARSAIATLGDMVGKTGDDDAGEVGQAE